jgi:hypothetical protein
MPPIEALPAVPADSHTIASLETVVFHDEEFSRVAFGPGRASAENISHRARRLTKELEGKNGGKGRVIKAVEGDEIVGAAVWRFISAGKEEGEGETDFGDKETPWGVGGANVRFCEDAFVVADKLMEKAAEGRDYAS